MARKKKLPIKPAIVQRFVLVYSKTGEPLMSFDFNQTGLQSLRQFVINLLEDRFNFNKAQLTQPMIYLNAAAKQDLAEGTSLYTDQALNRYGFELVPVEQINRESERRGWIPKQFVSTAS